MLEKWKRAVVHLECATDSAHLDERIGRIRDLAERHRRGEITADQFEREANVGARDLRSQGTALFVSHRERRYLLTARHVVWDEVSANRRIEEEHRYFAGLPEDIQQSRLKSAKEAARNTIFPIIFRVPSFDEIIAGHGKPDVLMNLGAGAFPLLPYRFSPTGQGEADLDLAVIALDQDERTFAGDLIARGFEPISSSEIADGPDCEGQEVFTVGFPAATSVIGYVEQRPADVPWSSAAVSLPVSSFGRVSMLHEQLPHFWADMSVYPGNSGGPVIADNRLVGIVSSQAIIPIDGQRAIYTRIPFANIIKAKLLIPMLDELAEVGDAWGSDSIGEFLMRKHHS